MMCAACRGRGFKVGYRNAENPLAPETARKRLFNSDTPYKCSECDNDGVWNNKPLILHMDHIDGNRKNNKPGNIRWLCPNCHSQTDTFGSRNKRG